MFKYYYFYSYSKLDKSSFNEIIRKSYSYYIDIEFSDDNNGIIMADENFSVRLLNIYNILLNDLGIAVVFLETFDLNNLSELSMKNLIINKEKGVFSLDEIILKAYLFKNKETNVPYLSPSSNIVVINIPYPFLVSFTMT